MPNPQLLKTHKTFSGLTQFWDHHSSTTRTRMRFSTFVPDERPRGALIWLSGLTCTEENFMAKAGAQKYLAEHQLMVICPDTSPRGLDLPQEHDSWDFGSGASFYVNATTPRYRDHYRMETYLLDEVYPLLAQRFDISEEKVSILGHSMGGHGALTLALRHPQKFRSVSAFAPIAHPTKCPWGIKAFTGYLGENQEVWREHDSTELLLAGRRHPHLILVDQGRKDEFLEKQLLTEDLIGACNQSGQPCEINIHEGYDHSYYFVTSFIENHIRFHAQALA